MRLCYVAMAAAVVAFSSTQARAQKDAPESRFKLGVGSTSLSDLDGNSLAIDGTTFRVSYNTMSPRKAQELRVGVNRFSGGSTLLDAQYIWKFGKKQNGYYGIGFGGFEGGSSSTTSVIGINVGKNLFGEVHAASIGSTSVYASTVLIGLRF
jgi:hypothetical protein